VHRSRIALVAAVTGMSLVAGWPTGVANAQQVCEPATLAGGEACFYTGRFLTGREFDVSVPLGQQLPVPTDGDCTDLPSGFGTGGSVTNASTATLYAFGDNCPDTRPATSPVAVVQPHHSGNIAGNGVTVRPGHTDIRSVRLCGPGLALDPIALTCSYLR
jgi:hypothetical protein